MTTLRPRFRAPLTAVTVVTVAVLGGALAGSGARGAAPVVDQETTTGRTAPVRAGTVPDHLNPGLVAARAQAERDLELRARFAATASDGETTGRAVIQGAVGPDGGDRTEPSPEAADVGRLDVRAQAAAVLAELPGGDAVEIAWNHPDIGNHLGGVRLDEPTVMMLNAHRFEAQPERIAATVKHEIGHYYQGAVIAAHADSAGGWWDAYWQLDAALEPVFGSAWMERSADCVALHLGADWTHYTDDCSAPAAQAAVEALIATQMP